MKLRNKKAVQRCKCRTCGKRFLRDKGKVKKVTKNFCTVRCSWQFQIHHSFKRTIAYQDLVERKEDFSTKWGSEPGN